MEMIKQRRTSLIYCTLLMYKTVTTAYEHSTPVENSYEKSVDNHIPIVAGNSEVKSDTNNNKGKYQEKCYEGLGCVRLTPEWWHSRWRPINILPCDRYAINTVFVHWFMQDNNVTSEVLGELNLRGILKLLVHDFTSNGYAGWIQHYSRVLLSNPANTGCNIISVNWAAGAEPPYVQAVANARLVALEISQFLNKLKLKYNSPSQVHIIGHGLGAHIAGYVGKMNQVQRITALDPSGPYFLHMPPNTRLHRDDASFVEVVHSDDFPAGQGYPEILGHADFYVNGGKHQPGCADSPLKVTALRRDHLKLGESMSACSHKRSLKYYIEALNQSYCSFIGFSCPTFKDFIKGKCSTCGENLEYCATLSSPVKAPLNNTFGFHFVTSDSGPFCTEILKVLLVLKSSFTEQSFVKGFFNVSVPQPVGDVNFLLNENHAISALGTDDHHVFMVFRSVPPPLVLPAEAVHIKWVQGPLPTAWSGPPKVTGLMIFKMTDKLEARPQWFCSMNGPVQAALGLGLEPCVLNSKSDKTNTYELMASTPPYTSTFTNMVDLPQLNYV